MHKLYTNHTKHLAVLLALVVHILLLALLFYGTTPSLHMQGSSQELETSSLFHPKSNPAQVSFGDAPQATQSLDKTTTKLGIVKPQVAQIQQQEESQSILKYPEAIGTSVNQSKDYPQQQTSTPSENFSKNLETRQAKPNRALPDTMTPENAESLDVEAPNGITTTDTSSLNSQNTDAQSFHQEQPQQLPFSSRGTQSTSMSQTSSSPKRRHRARNSRSGFGSGDISQDFASALRSVYKAESKMAQAAYQALPGQGTDTVSAAQIAQVHKQTAQFRYMAYNSNAQKILRDTFNIYRTEVTVPYDISTTVDITIVIDSEGKVLESTIIPSLGIAQLESSIIETIRKAHFSPLPNNFNTKRHTFSQRATVNLRQGVGRITCS